MKTKLLLSSLTLAIGMCISQTEVPKGVSVSNLYKFNKYSDRSQFEIDNKIYSFKHDTKRTFLQINSGKDFNLESVQTVGEAKGYFNLIETPLISEKKFGFLSQTFYHKKYITEYIEFDKSSNSFLPPIEINNWESDSKVSISKKQNYFVEVADSRKMKFGLLGDKKFNHEKVELNFCVYDSNIEKKWSKSITFPFDDSHYELNSVNINDDGEVFLFCTIYHNEKRELYNKAKEKTADQVLYHITENGPILINPTHLSNFGQAGSFCFVSDKAGNNYLAGLYQSNEEGAINYQGFFLSKIVNGEFQEAVTYPFDEDVIDDFLKQDKSKPPKPYSGTSHLSIKNIQFGEDQSITVFFNQMYSYTIQKKDYVSTVYVNQNIFISHALLNGNEAWTIKLPKFQVAETLKSELGYFESYTPDYSYLVYIDHNNNFSLPEDESPSKHMCGVGGYLTVCRINNKSGNIEKKQLFHVDKISQGLHLLCFDRFLNMNTKVVFDAYIKVKKEVMISLDYEEIF